MILRSLLVIAAPYQIYHVQLPNLLRLSYNSCMGWLRVVGSLKFQVSFAEYRLFYRALLQKRPVILRSLLIVVAPYLQVRAVSRQVKLPKSRKFWKDRNSEKSADYHIYSEKSFWKVSSLPNLLCAICATKFTAIYLQFLHLRMNAVLRQQKILKSQLSTKFAYLFRINLLIYLDWSKH